MCFIAFWNVPFYLVGFSVTFFLVLVDIKNMEIVFDEAMIYHFFEKKEKLSFVFLYKAIKL